MDKMNKVEALAENIQKIIVNCPNEQPYDEGIVWIFGSRTDIEDLLDAYEVPEDLKDDVDICHMKHGVTLGEAVGRYKKKGGLL